PVQSRGLPPLRARAPGGGGGARGTGLRPSRRRRRRRSGARGALPGVAAGGRDRRRARLRLLRPSRCPEAQVGRTSTALSGLAEWARGVTNLDPRSGGGGSSDGGGGGAPLPLPACPDPGEEDGQGPHLVAGDL